MEKLKWLKDNSGNIFDIRDGHRTFIIRKVGMTRELDFIFYGKRGTIPFTYISSAKKCAQLIYNG